MHLHHTTSLIIGQGLKARSVSDLITQTLLTGFTEAWHSRLAQRDQTDAGGSIAAAQAICMARDLVSGADCTGACCLVSYLCVASAEEALPSETHCCNVPVQHAPP